jgi:hypothetical protein
MDISASSKSKSSILLAKTKHEDNNIITLSQRNVTFES